MPPMTSMGGDCSGIIDGAKSELPPHPAHGTVAHTAADHGTASTIEELPSVRAGNWKERYRPFGESMAYLPVRNEPDGRDGRDGKDGEDSNEILSKAESCGDRSENNSLMVDGEASPELLELVVKRLMSGDANEAKDAAADMEYLVSSSQPKGELKLGIWRWSAQGSTQNRAAFGGVTGLWDSLLNIIQSGNAEGKAKACGAMSKLGFRNTYNVLNMMKHPGLLDALTDLLSEDKNPFKVQVQAWRVLQNCCSGIEEVKVIICSNQHLVNQLKIACDSQYEEVRMRAVSVVMHASSSDAAKLYLLKACIPEQALEKVINSESEESATRIRATLASANLCGREERSILSTAPAMLREIVKVLSHAMDETEYAGIKWSLAGVLLPLFNLSCSDTNKGELIKCGCVSVLLRLVKAYSPEVESSHELALRTLANLTFDSQATEQMIQQGAVNILTDVMLQGRGESIKSKQVAQDLIFMLSGGQNVEIMRAVEKQERRSRSHVMISYSWLEKKKNVVMLTDMLRKRGVDVWRDEEGSRLVRKMSGSSMDIMAEAIEVAEFVVVFVSRAYRDSYNCKLEGKYAQIRERAGLARIIYVMMEEDYTPQSECGVDGWLGMMIGDSIWYKGWDTAFLPDAAEGIETAARRGKTMCFIDSKVPEPDVPRLESTASRLESAASTVVQDTGSFRRRTQPPSKLADFKRTYSVPPKQDAFSTLGNKLTRKVKASHMMYEMEGPLAGYNQTIESVALTGGAISPRFDPEYPVFEQSVSEWPETHTEKPLCSKRVGVHVTEEDSEGSLGRSSASGASRLTQDMNAWIEDNKLEGLYDVFLYHHIDEPEIACLLTEQQVYELTDRIGLRLRLLNVIQKEKQKRLGKSDVASLASLSRVAPDNAASASASPATAPSVPSVSLLPSAASSFDRNASSTTSFASVSRLGSGRLFGF